MLLYRLAAKFEKENIDYAVVGGMALNLHKIHRSTIDLDIVVRLSLANLTKTENAINQLGLTSRLPVGASDIYHFRQEYIKNRNLIAWSFTNLNSPIEVLDIIITHDLKNMKKENLKIAGHNIKVICIEDLIKMKSKSHRPQDIEDIKFLRARIK